MKCTTIYTIAIVCILVVVVAVVTASTVNAQSTLVINSRCSDSACSHDCNSVQTYIVGDCVQVSSTIYAVVTSCPLSSTDSEVETTLYSDSQCQNALSSQNSTIDECVSGGGFYFIIQCEELESYKQVKTHHNQKQKYYPLTRIPSSAAGSRLYPHRSHPTRPTAAASVGQERHNVFFRYTNNTTSADRIAIDNMYRGIPSHPESSYVVSLEGGVPNSHEGFQQDMDIAYLTTFISVADRDFFVGRPFMIPYDPNHDAFKTFVGPYLRLPITTGLIVIDFLSV